MLLRDRFIQSVVKAYPAVTACQTEEGWLSYGGGKYTMYSQFAGYTLAWLYATRHPDNPYTGNAEVLDRAVRVWDHYATRINADGLFLIISGNQDYGYSLDEWGLYYWMKSAELLRGTLPAGKLENWDRVIGRIARKLGQQIRYPERLDADHGYNFRRNFAFHTSNHYVWCLLAFHLYGRLYGDASAMETAAEIMEEVFDHQLPAGCWLECGTPIVLYNDVTLSAISLYEHDTGSARAAEAVRRGLGYVLNTMYPDVSRIETLDGRNRYHRHDFGLCAPTYARHAEGRALLSAWIRHADEANSLTGDNLHGLANATATLEAIPPEAEVVEQDVSEFIPKDTDYPELKARVRRECGWVLPCCCLEQKEYDNRYVLYRQNLLSVFHEKAGLIVGGGNSIAQPQFSCFNVITRDKLHYIHEAGELLPGGRGMRLVYGGKQCQVEIMEVSPASVSVRYSVEGLSEVDRVSVNIPLVGQAGDAMAFSGEETAWGEQAIARMVRAGEPFRLRSAELSLSEQASFLYPVFPYNSYLQKQQGSLNEVFGIVTAELDYMRTEVTLKINIVSQ